MYDVCYMDGSDNMNGVRTLIVVILERNENIEYKNIRLKIVFVCFSLAV